MDHQNSYNDYKEKMIKAYQYNWVASRLFFYLYLIIFVLMISYGMFYVEDKEAMCKKVWPYIVWFFEVVLLFFSYQLRRCPVCSKHMGFTSLYNQFTCKNCRFSFKKNH